jgi:hypothetical protein
MLLALAAVFAIGWILAFLVEHVTTTSIHVLALGAVVSTLVHFVRVRRVRHVPGSGAKLG